MSTTVGFEELKALPQDVVLCQGQLKRPSPVIEIYLVDVELHFTWAELGEKHVDVQQREREGEGWRWQGEIWGRDKGELNKFIMLMCECEIPVLLAWS